MQGAVQRSIGKRSHVSLRAHGGEKDDIPNRRRIGQQHDQSINPDPTATDCRQAVFQRANEIGVVIHCLFVASILGLHLFLEARCLVFRIIQLGETIGDFTPDNEQLKAFRNLRIRIGSTGQRRDFDRVIDDEGRFPALGFGTGFEKLQLQAAQSACLDRLAEVLDLGFEEIGVGQLGIGEFRMLALDSLVDGQAMERLGEVKFAALIDEDFLAQRLAGGVAEQAFR